MFIDWDKCPEVLGVLGKECGCMCLPFVEGWVKKVERKRGSLKVEGAFKKKVTDFPVFLGLV